MNVDEIALATRVLVLWLGVSILAFASGVVFGQNTGDDARPIFVHTPPHAVTYPQQNCFPAGTKGTEGFGGCPDSHPKFART